jgi:hypothetical protein
MGSQVVAVPPRSSCRWATTLEEWPKFHSAGLYFVSAGPLFVLSFEIKAMKITFLPTDPLKSGFFDLISHLMGNFPLQHARWWAVG